MRIIDADALFEKVKKSSEDAGFYTPIYNGFLASIVEAPTIEQPTWIPVTERLPGEEQEVLCLTSDGSCRVFGWTYIDWMWFDDNEWWDEKDVTHWMPLPEPPKGDE